MSLVLVALSTLILGLVAGYLFRAATEPQAPQPAPPSASPRPPVTPAEPPPVAAPCSAAAERSEELLTQLDRAVQAIVALDPSALRAVVDEVERLQAQMRRALDECGAIAGPGTGTGPPVPAAPTTPR
jgi:hypothetical protein